MGEIWGYFVGFLEQVLLWFATFTGNAGLGIILFTVCTRLVILPLTLSSIRSSRRMQEIQPKMKELQRKHGKDAKKLQEETVKLYQQHQINPVGGCVPLLFQLPIFFGVYQAVYHLMLPEQQQYLSAGVKAALLNESVKQVLHQPFLGLLDLGRAPFTEGFKDFHGPEYLILPILSVILQFIQQVMATPRMQDPQQKAMTQTMLFMPLVFGYIAFTFPAGAVLYWVTSSVVGIVQQYFTSGWGSLANYLPFLPPDQAPQPELGLEGEANQAPSGAAQAAPNSLDFWDLLRPLTELEPEGGPRLTKTPEPLSEAARQVGTDSSAEGEAQAPNRRSRRRK